VSSTERTEDAHARARVTEDIANAVGDEVAIRAVGLTRRFESVTAVDALDLEVAAGTVFGFLGPNGAGKTTTIRLLLGLLEPTAGRASVLGHDATLESDAVRVRCGVLLEHTGLYERLSATENLAYFGRLWHLGSAELEARIVELLAHFGLADRRHETVGTWSRGMKQKLALARALLHRPRVVFLDEPTAGLDPIAAAGLRADLLDLARREAVTVFITTHNLDEAERICNRVGVIRCGRLVAEGPPDSLRRGTTQTVTVLGSGFDRALEELRVMPVVVSAEARDGHLQIELRESTPVAPLVRLLVERGVDIEEVRKGAGSLEEAFLTILDAPEVER
jgi:ABC-2 type transport system ATP-binding protein